MSQNSKKRMINYALGLSLFYILFYYFVMHNNEHNDQIFTAEVEKVVSKLFFMIVVGLFS